MSEIMPDKRFTEVVNGQQVVRAIAVSGDIIPEPAKDPSKYFTALVNTDDGPQQVVKVLPIGTDGNPLTIDSELSTASENPVQNKVVTSAIAENADAIYENTEAIDVINAELGTNPPWKNPASWPDIRMGALSHSYYFFVAHSTPVESEGTYTIANYPKFSFSASISTPANSYDVYVDGLKVASATSGATTTIDWEALYTAGTVAGGYNVDNPSSMVAHIVRITPTTSTDAITGVAIRNYSAGTLWVHITEENPVNLDKFLERSATIYSPLCQAVTTNQPTLVFTSAGEAFARSAALVELPILEQAPDSVSGDKRTYGLIQGCSHLKRVRLKNIKNAVNESSPFFQCTRLEKIEAENCVLKKPDFYECVNLKSLGGLCLDFSEATNVGSSFNSCRSLEPFFLDLSNAPLMTGLTVNPDRYNPVNGLKGIVVDNTAPFDRSSSPQINIAYTGLDRIALINLFKSMPTVTNNQVCNITGATGDADLTASDLAIATGKGWTITR